MDGLQFVNSSIKSTNNDLNDAEEMTESGTRPTMRFVPINATEPQEMQALHRVRERLIGVRMALVNDVHGQLSAYGIVIPKRGTARWSSAS